ncbi:MAG: hypothetical protein Q9227_004140 [Pyrenula ochraceoflavens]
MPSAAPASPVKRVTRARAAAKKEIVSEGLPISDPKPSKRKTTKNTEPEPETKEGLPEMEPPRKPTRKAAAAPAILAAPPRRKLKITPLNDAVQTQPQPEEKPTSKKKSTPKATSSTASTRAKTAETSEHKPAQAIDQESKPPKRATRGKKEASVPIEVQEPEPVTNRGKARKAAVAATDPIAEAQHQNEAPQRSTRTRSGSGATATRATASTAAKAIASKKKVTFQEPSESDKENQPLAASKSKSKKSETSGVKGINAKPARKTATSTRGRKAASKKEELIEPEAQPKPLSPKKITQIAKSTSSNDSDEDELSGGKTPLRDLGQSPRRHINLSAATSPVKKLEFSTELHPQSPTREIKAPIMMSPPRRPPPSPFKDTLKCSPKRSDVPFTLPQSAKKATTATPQLQHSQSSLQQSPKRGNVDVSIFQNSAIRPSKTPLKASLLQSPPKRLFSPEKQTSKTFSPVKTNDWGTIPDFTVNSNARMPSARSQRTLKVHEDDPFQDECAPVDFDASVLDIRSPVRVLHSAEAQNIDKIAEEPMQGIQNDFSAPADQIMADEEVEAVLEEEQGVENDVPVETTAQSQGVVSPRDLEINVPQRMSVNEQLFRARRFSSEEESEDELQSESTPIKPDTQTPAAQQVAPARSRLSIVQQAEANRGVGFTPLAVQLSNWLAASPDKPLPKKERRGVFSPVKVNNSPAKPRDRCSIRSRTSAGSRMSLGPRLSVGLPMDDPTFFEDEMAQKVLGEEAESIESDERPDVAMPDQTSVIMSSEGAMSVVEPDQNVNEPVVETGTSDELMVADFIEEAHDEHEKDDEKERIRELQDASTNSNQDMSVENYDENLLEDEDLDTYSIAAVAESPKLQAQIQAALDSEPLLHDSDDENPVYETQHSNAGAIDDAPIEAESFLDDEYEADAIEIGHANLSIINELPEEESDQSVYGDENEPPVASPTGGRNVKQHLSPQPFVDERQASSTSIQDADETSEGNAITQSPIQLRTPVRPNTLMPRYCNTVVSKVPLRPEAEDSIIKLPRKRSRSLSGGPLPPRKSPRSSPEKRSPGKRRPLQGLSPLKRTQPAVIDAEPISPVPETSKDQEPLLPAHLTPPKSNISQSSADAPISAAKARTPARISSTHSSILSGAVIFVDVHTTEGADASGIFVELLTAMGARCLKSWTWNPRASIAPADPFPRQADSPSSAAVSRPGITHVVFKDGGKRTLEKVRDTKGLVKCIGVGWVLDCEAKGEWLDEAPYLVDTSVFPRGGSRRRKSMEPRALVNQNGRLFEDAGSRGMAAERRKSFVAGAGARRSVSVDLSPLRKVYLSPMLADGGAENQAPASDPVEPLTRDVEESFAFTGQDNDDEEEEDTELVLSTTATPTGFVAYDPVAAGVATPMTPYLMAKGRGLVQMSAPPKQVGKGLFEVEDEERDDSEIGGRKENGVEKGKLRLKMEGARRRQTLGIGAGGGMDFRPVVGSPLGR